MDCFVVALLLLNDGVVGIGLVRGGPLSPRLRRAASSLGSTSLTTGYSSLRNDTLFVALEKMSGKIVVNICS